MTDLVERAQAYATSAHQRIGQLRKYNQQPYHVHLEAVAKLVAEVTSDPETIAAAWLHDTVEDTPATLEDIEGNFGLPVAELVEELSDVSKPSDGNRARRKAIDCDHSAQASPRAKTVKLADLIDNCTDITKHDPRFARVYLVEMGALLDVLDEGNEQLFQEAVRVYAGAMEKLGFPRATQKEPETPQPDSISLAGFDDQHFKRMFMEIFAARDIAEGLLSFDSGYDCADVVSVLKRKRKDVAGVRVNGMVQGYLRLSDIDGADATDSFRNFTVDQVVSGSATFADVIHVLTRHDYCFVTMLGGIGGVVGRDDINKPIVRMWLFGIVTMVEMGIVQLIHERFPDAAWQAVVSAGRLQKAMDIQAERQRRNQYCELIDCLQLTDKAQILINDEVALEQLGFDTKSAAKRSVKELESLRNHLAHAQDIVMHDWAQIARLTRRMEEITRG